MVKIAFLPVFAIKKVFCENRENGQFSGVVAPEVKGLEIFYRYEKCSKCFVESKKQVLNTQNDLKHVFSNFEFWTKKSFFNFSAEISA